MSDKNEEDHRNHEDDDPGFRINLPFGFGWLRGDGSHLSLLMPLLKWLVFCSSMAWLVIQILRELRTP